MAAPIALCDTKGLSREDWLKVRAHGPKSDIPITIGGSDVGIILGVSPFKTAAELWYEKRDAILPEKPKNQAQLDFGHHNESFVARQYERLTGNRIIEDTIMYQHPLYLPMIADLDYRYIRVKDNTEGIFDSKTTSYRKAHLWSNGAMPIHIEVQLRHYMAVCDRPIATAGCLWGNNPDSDFAHTEIERDLIYEDLIIEAVMEFVDSIHKGKPPSLTGAPSKLAMRALARIYGSGDSSLPAATIAECYANHALLIAQKQREIKVNKDHINKLEEEVAQLSVQICEALGQAEHGIIMTNDHEILLDYATKTTNRADTKKLKADYPVIYDSLLKSSTSRKLQVVVKDRAS